jgi:hypothetical protein
MNLLSFELQSQIIGPFWTHTMHSTSTRRNWQVPKAWLYMRRVCVSADVSSNKKNKKINNEPIKAE